MTQLLGTSTINGLHVGHTETEVLELLRFIQSHNIKKFVEVGVHVGGLANILTKLVDLKYMGIEYNPSLIDNSLRDKGIFFVFGDCFAIEVQQKVQMFLYGMDGASLVYCDNGNKPQELMAYHSLIRVDDYILAHDYYDTIKTIDDLPGFGIDLEFPKPEVLPEDVKFLQDHPGYVEIKEGLEQSRICAFKRIK